MNLTAAAVDLLVTAAPRSTVDSLGSRVPQTPVDDISAEEVFLPVSSAFNPSAKNTSLAVGSSAIT